MLCAGVQLWGRGRGRGEPCGLGLRACLRDLHQSPLDGLTSGPTASWLLVLFAAGAPGLTQGEGRQAGRCVGMGVLAARAFVPGRHSPQPCPKDRASEAPARTSPSQETR